MRVDITIYSRLSLRKLFLNVLNVKGCFAALVISGGTLNIKAFVQE